MDNDSGSSINVPPAALAPAVMLSYATPNQLGVPEEWTHIDVFVLAPEKLQGFILASAAVTCAAVLFFGSAIVYLITWLVPTFPILYLAVMMAFYAVMTFITLIRRMLRVKQQWPSYRIALGDQGFLRTSKETPLVRVNLPEVMRIVETWDSFKIFISGGRHVVLSKRVQNLGALRTRLAAWKKIQPAGLTHGIPAMILTGWTLSLASLTLIYIGAFTDKRHIVLECAAGSLLLLGIRVWFLFRQKGIPVRSRIAMLIAGIAPLTLIAKWAMMLWTGR